MHPQTDFEMALLKHSLQSYGVEAEEEPSTSPNEIVAFADAVGVALSVLRYMVTDLKEFLPHSQDTGASSPAVPDSHRRAPDLTLGNPLPAPSVIFGSASTASWLAKNLFRMHHLARQESLLAIQGAMHLFRSISQGEDAFGYQGLSASCSCCAHRGPSR